MGKQSNKVGMIVLAVVAAIFGIVLAGAFFKAPAKNSQKVLEAPVVPATFPDVKNDPSYKIFLNSNAIDPTQAVNVGGNQNSNPFSGSQ